LFLLLPLLMLVTPWFNQTTPRLAGVPFFYWFQFLFVVISVACVSIVYLATRHEPTVTSQPDRLSVDDLDEGGRS
jgi:NADH:ubiquinone oxidoreductase subunit 6 (subunit J)